MKLRFFNGEGEQKDTDRLEVVNQALKESGLAFTLFRLNDQPVYSLKRLCERMAKRPAFDETMLAMLHWTGCDGPALAGKFIQWDISLRRNLIVIIFSGDTLSESTIRSVVEAGKKAEIAAMFWLSKGLREAVAAPEVIAFSKWLGSELKPTRNAIIEKLEGQLQTLNSGATGREILAALKVLCEAWLLNNWSQGGAYGRLPTLKGGLQLEGDKPTFPVSFRVQHPETIAKWLAPFRELAGTEQDDALIKRIIESLDGEASKTAARNLFAGLVATVEYERVADSFLIFNETVKSHT